VAVLHRALTRWATPWLGIVLAVGLGVAAADPTPAPAKVVTRTRFSLATMSPRAAWEQPGFRLQLGLGYGRMIGLNGPPSGRLIGPILRVGTRLDTHWSIMGSLQYLAATETGGLSGLRFAGTVEPTWHFSRRLSLALGIGFGGLVEGRTLRPDPEPAPGTLEASYTFPDAKQPLSSCTGTGVTGLVHVDWMGVIGSRTSSGFALEGFTQWTGCVADTNRVEPDTAQPIVRRQWWPHAGVTLAWLVAWR
jgi:hypothetical protein